jgi:hypothetical protein
MKVSFYLDENITEDHFPESEILIGKSIQNKINNTVFELPFLPTKGMKVDLCLFTEVLGFNTDQKRFLELDSPLFVVYDLYIKPDGIEICLVLVE